MSVYETRRSENHPLDVTGSFCRYGFGIRLDATRCQRSGPIAIAVIFVAGTGYAKS